MRKFREMLKDNAAFTLVELIVVIAVLGILAGIAIPRLTGVQDKAEKETLKANARTVYNALEMYQADTGDFPDDLDDLTTDSGISIDITDINVSDNGSGEFTVTSENDNYTITVTSGGIGAINDK